MFDCIFLNGDSYSAYAPEKITYGEFLRDQLNVPLINQAVVGSNNDRIIRSSIDYISSLIEQGQRPLVIIGLSFVRRLEVWYYGNNKDILSKIPDSHSNLNLITLSHLVDAREVTTEQKALIIDTTDVLHKRLIDFYMNLFLFYSWLEKLELDYFIFSPARNTDCSPYSLNISRLKFVNQCLNNPKIWNLHNFCFLDWAKDHDMDAKPTGHLSTDGHKKFADILLANLILQRDSHGNI